MIQGAGIRILALLEGAQFTFYSSFMGSAEGSSELMGGVTEPGSGRTLSPSA